LPYGLHLSGRAHADAGAISAARHGDPVLDRNASAEQHSDQYTHADSDRKCLVNSHGDAKQDGHIHNFTDTKSDRERPANSYGDAKQNGHSYAFTNANSDSYSADICHADRYRNADQDCHSS
jgi:hypothetical protein